jgi:hypothetical protein
MRCLAAASSALRPVLAAPPRPARCLGVARGALYLQITEPPGVLAILCHDAVRLPCGLVLPATGTELPLTSLAAATDSFLVGGVAVRWTGPAGRVDVRVVREWAPARSARGAASASVLAAVRAALRRCDPSLQVDGCPVTIAGAIAAGHPRPEDGADPGAGARLHADIGAAGGDHYASVAATEARTIAAVAEAAGDDDASVAAVAGLLGRGPGLTPSGDDALAGYLAGAAAFGLDATALRRAIAVLAPDRTTALSAALLWHAARGECIDELAAVVAVLTSQPRREPERAGAGVGSLLSVGHRLSAALPGGPVTGADGALHQEAERAVRRLLSVGHSSGAALARGLVLAAELALNRQAGRAA